MPNNNNALKWILLNSEIYTHHIYGKTFIFANFKAKFKCHAHYVASLYNNHTSSAFVWPRIAVWVPMHTYLSIRTAKVLHWLEYLPCPSKSPLSMVTCSKIEEISYLYIQMCFPIYTSLYFALICRAK